MTDQVLATATNPPSALQISLIKQELQPYINTRYVLEARLRVVAGLVQKSILKEDDKKPILDELTRMQGYIDGYNEIIAELETKLPKPPDLTLPPDERKSAGADIGNSIGSE